jgi:hypothetical protein
MICKEMEEDRQYLTNEEGVREQAVSNANAWPSEAMDASELVVSAGDAKK